MQNVAPAVPVAQVASAQSTTRVTSARYTHTQTLDAKRIHQMLFDQSFNVPYIKKPLIDHEFITAVLMQDKTCL